MSGAGVTKVVLYGILVIRRYLVYLVGLIIDASSLRGIIDLVEP